MQQADTNVIEIDQLVTHYGQREILKGVDLQVRQGEIMVIMGGSGSGKTTLMRNLLGLNRPTSGSIRVLGNDITRISTRELYALRRKMGVSFQGGALPRMASSCSSGDGTFEATTPGCTTWRFS